MIYRCVRYGTLFCGAELTQQWYLRKYVPQQEVSIFDSNLHWNKKTHTKHKDNSIRGSTCHNRRSQYFIEIYKIKKNTQRQWYLKKYVSQQEVWTLVQIDIEKYKCRKKVLEKLNCDIVLQGSRAQDLDTKKLTNMAVFGYAIAPKCEPCSTPLGGPFVDCQLELSLPHHKIIFVHLKKPSQPIAMSNLFLPQLYKTHFYFYLNVYFFFYSYFLSNLYSYFLFFYFLLFE